MGKIKLKLYKMSSVVVFFFFKLQKLKPMMILTCRCI